MHWGYVLFSFQALAVHVNFRVGKLPILKNIALNSRISQIRGHDFLFEQLHRYYLGKTVMFTRKMDSKYTNRDHFFPKKKQ